VERPIVSSLEDYFRENFGEKLIEPQHPWLGIFDNDFNVCGLDVWLYFAATETATDSKLKDALAQPKNAMKEFDDRIIEVFGKEFVNEYESLARIDNPGNFTEARKRLADRMKPISLKKGIDAIRQKSDQVRKELSRHSAELAGKKLDLAVLERQYLEAR
jgi:hypothetical protein